MTTTTKNPPNPTQTQEKDKTNQDDDDFASLFNLEENYYTQGFHLGTRDGSRAGLIEGRLFGLEKGFEKFAAMGVLAGRCLVWQARLPSSLSTTAAAAVAPAESSHDYSFENSKALDMALPRLAAGGARLQKHLQTLYALTESESLSTENNEDSVSDFDDRLKRAEGKVKLIEKLIGETSGPLILDHAAAASSPSSSSAPSNSEQEKRRQVKIKRPADAETNMEDFNIAHAPS
jgi:hypothetical protein